MCPFLKLVRNPVYVTLSALSFSWTRRDRSANRVFSFHPALLCFLALIAISTLWAVNPEDAALRVAGLLLVFVFLWNLLRTTDLARIATWLGDGLLYASYATIVLIAVGGRASDPEQGNGRLNLGDDLEATGTAAICMWALVRLFGEGMSSRGKRRIFHFILAGVALVAMMHTGTRGTLLQLAIVLPLLSTIHLPMKNMAGVATRYVLLILIMLIGGAAIWASLGEDRQSSYMAKLRIGGNGDEHALDSRNIVWKPAMEKAKERPWLGRGFGSSSFFMFADDEYRDSSFAGMPYRTTVHSQYLEIFYEFGILGFIVFSCLLVVLLRNAVRIYSYNGPHTSLWRLLAIYAVVGVVEGLSHGGQLATGELNLLQRWLLYCCVLSFPLALSGAKQRFALPRLVVRLRASRAQQIKIPRLSRITLANQKWHTRSRRVWPSCRRFPSK